LEKNCATHLTPAARVGPEEAVGWEVIGFITCPMSVMSSKTTTPIEDNSEPVKQS